MIIKKFPIISILDPQLYIRKKNEITLLMGSPTKVHKKLYTSEGTPNKK